MKDQKNKMSVSAIVAISSFGLGFVIIFFSIRGSSPVMPLIGFCIAFFGVLAASIIQSASKKKDPSAVSDGRSKAGVRGTAAKYVSVLCDERTKQDPQVQRLLQYTSVQKAFFDPDFLDTAEAQSDPNIGELLGVLDNIVLEQTASGTYQPPTQFNNTLSNAERERYQDELNRQKRAKNKPRKVAGLIISGVGFLLFMVPFFGGVAGVNLFGFAPVGMILLVAGSVVARI